MQKIGTKPLVSNTVRPQHTCNRKQQLSVKIKRSLKKKKIIKLLINEYL